VAGGSGGSGGGLLG